LARIRGRAPVADSKGREGFHAHRTTAGEHDIRLVFELPRGNKIGRLVSSLAMLTAVALLIWEWKRKREQAA
jgi:hypothetical protein